MQSLSNQELADMLCYVAERSKLTMERVQSIHSFHEFLNTPGNMDIFDATCMRLQTIGETIRCIDELTGKELLAQYPEVPWRHVIGLRNIISHDYLSIDPEEIYKIVKVNMPLLHKVILRILHDVEMSPA